MSLQTWKQEFYPVEASELRSKPWLEAIQHSLRKWIGLKKENLDKHELVYLKSGNYIVDETDKIFMIDGSSCSLCQRDMAENCVTCPLYKKLKLKCAYVDSPYYFFKTTGNPEPMIEALKATFDSYQQKLKSDRERRQNKKLQG